MCLCEKVVLKMTCTASGGKSNPTDSLIYSYSDTAC